MGNEDERILWRVLYMRDLKCYSLAKACGEYLDGELMTQNDRRKVMALKARVSDKEFKRFVGYYTENLCYSDIAGLEGVRPSSVQRSVHLVEDVIYKNNLF